MKGTENLYEKLFKNANLKLRQAFFEKEAQAELSKEDVDAIIKDLIVDTRFLKNEENFNSAYHINFQNGVFDMQKKRLLTKKEAESLFFTYRLNANYLNAAERKTKMPHFEEFLANSLHCQIGDTVANYFMENIGYLLSSVNTLRKVVIFLGAPASGKSTFAKFVGNLIFPQNEVSHVAFQDIGQRFYTPQILYAKLNIGDVMAICSSRTVAMFKAITSGETLSVDEKFKAPIDLQANVRQLYTANRLPYFGPENTAAVFDRFALIIFGKSIPQEKRDGRLVQKLWQERDRIVSLSVDCFSKVLDNGGRFSVPHSVSDLKSSLENAENSVAEFVRCELEFDESGARISCRDIYQKYASLYEIEKPTSKERTAILKEIIQYFKIENGQNVIKKRMRIGSENVNGFENLRFRMGEK